MVCFNYKFKSGSLLNWLLGLFFIGLLFNATGVKAQPGNALNFDGTDDIVDCGSNSSLSFTINDDFTLSLWVKFSSLGSNEVILSKRIGNSGSDNEGYVFWKNDSDKIEFQFDDKNGNRIRAATTNANINSTNHWYHVVGTYTAPSTGPADANDFAIYVNGSSKSITNNQSSNKTIPLSNDITNSAPFRIGAQYLGNRLYFNGRIDEVKIWSETRTQSEIKKYMHQRVPNPSSKSNLVAYYKLNGQGGTSTTAIDAAGSNNGTLNNSSGTWWVSSNAVLTDATNKLTNGKTFNNDLAAIWPSNTNESSSGLTVTPTNSFSTGEDMVFGHNSQSGENNTNNSGLQTSGSYSGSNTVEIKLKRRWLIDDNAGSKNVDLTFDVVNAGASQGISGFNSKSDYVLIQTDVSPNKIIQSASGVSTSNNTVSFTSVAINSTYTLGSTNESGSPLPVELTSFEVEKQEEALQLTWATASETNNSHFIIQRRTEKNWENIGKVFGNGTTTTPREYNFIDEHPQQGTNYYRLKQVDFDGSYEYSGVRAVTFGESRANAETTLKILENPVRHQLRLTIQNDKRQSMNYQLVNSQGNAIRQGQWEVNKGRNTYRIATQDLESGAYFLKVQGKNEVMTSKLIK